MLLIKLIAGFILGMIIYITLQWVIIAPLHGRPLGSWIIILCLGASYSLIFKDLRS